MSESREFCFLWDEAEHRRFYRAINREARKSSMVLRLLWGWLWLVMGFFSLGLLVAREGTSRGLYFQILLPLGGFILFMRLLAPYLVGRTYAAEHAACIPNDQVRILTADGIEARCTTSQVSIRWEGIAKVRETPEFFLFFTNPRCAIQLPKRVVDDVPALREWLKVRMAAPLQQQAVA